MVTKLGFSGSLSAVLNYNEKKVQQGKAELIHAGNFLREKDRLNYHEKYDRFQNLNDLNEKVNVNTLHAKISFYPDETISDEALIKIADKYMEGIGFKDQPYLVYRHDDSAQPHVHIVSTIIKEDGSRIPTHNMGKTLSEPTRKAIEKEFKIEKAEDHRQTKEFALKPVDTQKIIYGEKGTKESIQQVLRMAIDNYKFTSLSELNALLRQYNVHADRGLPESQTYKHGGLFYKVLNEEGKVIGTPIKASSFYFKPTLKNLEVKFEKSKTDRKKDLPDIRSRIDWVLSLQPRNLEEFIKDLRKEDIDVLAWQNEQGQVYGMTYTDHKTMTVVNGSDLGKEYSAKAILEMFMKPDKKQSIKKTQMPNPNPRKQEEEKPNPTEHNHRVPQFLSDLFKHRRDDDMPHQLTQDQKKKKRKRH